MSEELLQRARNIRLAVFDVDGVLTDGKLYFLPDGSEFKTFNTLDGHGIKMLIQAGVQTAIITGRSSPVVERRAKNLGIHHLFQGREDKLAALDELLARLGLERSRSPTWATICPTCRRSAGSAWAWRWPTPIPSSASTPTASPGRAAAKARPASSAS